MSYGSWSLCEVGGQSVGMTLYDRYWGISGQGPTHPPATLTRMKWGYASAVVLVGAIVALAVSGCRGRDSGLDPDPPDLDSMVTIRTSADVAIARQKAIHGIFGEGGIPSSVPSATASDKGIRLSSGGVLMAAPEPNGWLAVYHAGHGQTATASPIVKRLLGAGYDVLALDMPAGPHERFANLPHALEPFMTPIALGLNYAMTRRKYEGVEMLGVSGGGWATTVYAAIDPRISRSYPIAGSLPLSMRAARDKGDFEQQLPGLGMDYLDFYLLASSEGRQQVQILNAKDPCCFAGETALKYGSFITGRARELGGSFGVVIDMHYQHGLSTGLSMLMFDSAPRHSLAAPVDGVSPREVR